MNREQNDVFIGLAVLAFVVTLSLIAGGIPALLYGGGFVVFGVTVLILLNRRNEGSRITAIAMMPAVLLGKLLPKEIRSQLSDREKETGEK